MVQFYFDSITYDDPDAENKINFNLKIKVDPINHYMMLTKTACISYSKTTQWSDEVNVNESSFDKTNGTFIIEKCSVPFLKYLYESQLKEKDVRFRYNERDIELQKYINILKIFTKITFS